MARVEKPPEGSWTAAYPELGTEPVSYEDSISPEVYELEREAIFKRTWLNVGRVEQLPRKGSYLTKELEVAKTSVVVVRGMDGELRAFHNICRHRGNKLVWTDFPREETSGTCRQFVCKYHGWKYDLDGACSYVQQEDEFFDLDKADYGLVPVHCDVWSGFVFVNLDQEPRQSLRDFLGPMITAIEGYPFHLQTERFSYRAVVGSNWKLFMDAFQEFYHAPVLHAKQSPIAARPDVQAAGFEGLHYKIDGPHRLVTTMGGQGWRLPPEMLKPMETLTRSGLFGPWDAPDLGLDTLVPHVPLLAHVVQHARLRGEPLLRPCDDGARTARARDGRGHVQGVRAAGRQHAGGDADDARVAGGHSVPAQRPGDPLPAPAQDRRRLGRRLRARARRGRSVSR
jgi:nitrite reductase/ring-hydroxylating ferredoxin subunit